jgi:hypothetical protein
LSTNVTVVTPTACRDSMVRREAQFDSELAAFAPVLSTSQAIPNPTARAWSRAAGGIALRTFRTLWFRARGDIPRTGDVGMAVLGDGVCHGDDAGEGSVVG